jgi:hypothetical protein
MTLDDILKSWQVDNVIDPTDVGNASLQQAKLHSKYLRFLSEERLVLKKLRAEYKQLQKLKYEYYTGSISQEDLKNNGWDPNLLKILRTDVTMYIDADADVVKHTLKVGAQEEKVDALDSILKNINNRGFQIKNYIDFIKFTNGAI